MRISLHHQIHRNEPKWIAFPLGLTGRVGWLSLVTRGCRFLHFHTFSWNDECTLPLFGCGSTWRYVWLLLRRLPKQIISTLCRFESLLMMFWLDAGSPTTLSFRVCNAGATTRKLWVWHRLFGMHIPRKVYNICGHCSVCLENGPARTRFTQLVASLAF